MLLISYCCIFINKMKTAFVQLCQYGCFFLVLFDFNPANIDAMDYL
jgi:hypothetical protein